MTDRKNIVLFSKLNKFKDENEMKNLIEPSKNKENVSFIEVNQLKELYFSDNLLISLWIIYNNILKDAEYDALWFNEFLKEK